MIVYDVCVNVVHSIVSFVFVVCGFISRNIQFLNNAINKIHGQSIWGMGNIGRYWLPCLNPLNYMLDL
jgi:phage-related protein